MTTDDREINATKDVSPADGDEVVLVAITCPKNNPLQLSVHGPGAPMDIINALNRALEFMRLQAVRHELSTPRIVSAPANVLPFGRRP